MRAKLASSFEFWFSGITPPTIIKSWVESLCKFNRDSFSAGFNLPKFFVDLWMPDSPSKVLKLVIEGLLSNFRSFNLEGGYFELSAIFWIIASTKVSTTF